MLYSKWKELSDEGYSSDVISFLLFLKNGEELDSSHPKTKALLALMERKELVIDGKISVKGEELLENLGQLGEISNKELKIDKFDEWWKIYPSTDAFIWNGQEFGGAQTKRIKKDMCKKHFAKLINSGLEADDIIKATIFHIEKAKKLSVSRKENQLTYVPNSERYLREKIFEPYIEISKAWAEVEEFKSNVL